MPTAFSFLVSLGANIGNPWSDDVILNAVRWVMLGIFAPNEYTD